MSEPNIRCDCIANFKVTISSHNIAIVRVSERYHLWGHLCMEFISYSRDFMHSDSVIRIGIRGCHISKKMGLQSKYSEITCWLMLFVLATHTARLEIFIPS